MAWEVSFQYDPISAICSLHSAHCGVGPWSTILLIGEIKLTTTRI